VVKNIKRQRTMGALEKSVGMFAAPPQGEPAAAAAFYEDLIRSKVAR